MNTPEKQIGQHNLPTPLIADPRRQATGLFKGLDFQIWLTVLAWVGLTDDQLLVVEGVEDYDIVEQGGGITTQVKALGEPISLRSPCVVEAIRNYWQNRHRNRGFRLEYRFVTTADIVVEQGEPFGPLQAGLSLWTEDSAARKATHSEALRRFLLDDHSVGPRLAAAFPPGVASLRDFLETASAEVLFDQLLCPIRWWTGHEGVESARRDASLALHIYGEKMGLQPSDSDRALPHLFTYVARKGSFKEQRNLVREDFRCEFETAVKPFLRDLSLVRTMASAIERQFSSSGGGTQFSDEELLQTAPPLPLLCAPRTELVEKIAATIADTKFVSLHGSTGKGKTMLANLVAARTGRDWVWFRFAGKNPDAIQAGLYRAARIADGSGGIHFVLDNFDPDGAAAVRLIEELAAMTRLALARGAQIIVTAQRPLPGLFLRETALPDQSIIQVPNLERDEVLVLCQQAGCIDPKQAQVNAAIVMAQTGGHPQLVHASISVRQRRRWPAPAAEELLQVPTELVEERHFARQLLKPLDEGEVEFLYRLSLATGFFRRDHAVAAAEIQPSIRQPGDKFNRFLGPWIEPVGSNYFRLSPLLSRSAEENWSKERVAAMRSAYGRAVVKCKSLTLEEASEVLMQSVLIRDAELAGPILAQLTMAPLKRRTDCAEKFWWLLALTDSAPVFPDNTFVNLLFRQVQFRLAAAKNERMAPKFAEMLMAELERPMVAKAQDLVTASVTGDILIALRVLVHPRLLLLAWKKTKEAAASSEWVGAVARYVEQKRPRRFVLPQQDYADLMFSFILCRHGGGEFLKQLLEAVEELGEAERGEVIAAMRANLARLLGFIDRVWADELVKPVRDWETVIAALRIAWDAGKRWGLPELVTCAARGIAAIEDEYLDHSGRALAVLAEAAQGSGGDGILLRYQRATIFSRQSRFAEAYEACASTLDEWETGDVESALYALFAFSKAGTCAGHLNRWEDAARIFVRGRGIARKVLRSMDATAFGVDAAYALWRAGHKGEAVSLFANCLAELERQAGAREPSGLHTLWKCTEQIILWCAADAGGPKLQVDVPRAGLCSEPKDEERHIILKGRPRGPLVLTWALLADAELGANIGRTVFDTAVGRADSGMYPIVRAKITHLKLQRTFLDREFSCLPMLVEQVGTASSIAQGIDQDGRTAFVPNPDVPVPQTAGSQAARFAVEAFSTALLRMAVDGLHWVDFMAEWRSSMAARKPIFDLEALLATVERVMGMTWTEAARVYKQAGDDRLVRLLSSLRLATCPDSSLAACFVGSVSLVTDDGLLNGLLGARDALGLLIKKIWRERLRFRVEFNLPRVSVPAVETACDLPLDGTKLAASILLAAQTAVSTRIPENVMKKLRELAGA